MVDFFKQTLYLLINLLSPHDKKVEKILKLDSFELLRRLPKPRSMEEESAYALFDYRDGEVRTIIKATKYKGNLDVIKRMALYLYEEIIEFASDISLFDGSGQIIIMPIPASNQRKVERGWNQCVLLCREMQKLAEKDLLFRFDILKKIKDTRRQTDLKREERLNNVKGSMEAVHILGKNHTVIVIDDVYTTGATFSEAKRALKAAGAKRVIGFFLAH